jgi:hypothetical protein
LTGGVGAGGGAVVVVVVVVLVVGVAEPAAAARLGTKPEAAIAAVRDVIERARRRRMGGK